MKQLPTKTKDQLAFQQGQLGQARGMEGAGGSYSQALDLLKQYLDPSSEAMKQFAAPYMNEFEQQTIPRLAEQFAGYNPMGSGLMTSGFAQAAGGAGAGLQAKLAGLKSALAQGSAGSLINQYNQLAGQGLTDQFAYGSQPGGGGVLGGFGAGSAQSLPLLMWAMMQGQGGQNTPQQFKGGGGLGSNASFGAMAPYQ